MCWCRSQISSFDTMEDELVQLQDHGLFIDKCGVSVELEVSRVPGLPFGTVSEKAEVLSLLHFAVVTNPPRMSLRVPQVVCSFLRSTIVFTVPLMSQLTLPLSKTSASSRIEQTKRSHQQGMLPHGAESYKVSQMPVLSKAWHYSPSF
jgi:hypothetical protein